MATKPAQSFENPLYSASGGSLASDMSGYTFLNPAASTGVDSLQSGLADIAAMGAVGQKLTQFELPQIKRPPAIAYSPSQKKLFVQGVTFAEDDSDMTLRAEQLLDQPSVGMPTGGDWVTLTPQAYGQIAGGIRNPGLGRLMSKNFGIGVDQLQLLAGRGLQLAGAEETGQGIVDTQMEDLRKNLPFRREFSDVDSTKGAIDWLAATVAQQGPNILESIGVAAAGFFAGTAAGGPLAGAGGALAGLAGKTAFKQSVIAALKKRAAGEALDGVETKLLKEAAGIAGATIASVGQNYTTGAADIYGEFREQGSGADDTNARLAALSNAVPYALLESLPEFFLASRLFGRGGLSARGGAANLQDIQGKTFFGTQTLRGGELLKRAGKGAIVGGTAEGATELGQESLLIGVTGQDFADSDVQKRLLESFAAGFGVGGTIGAGANLRRGPINKQPTNLLNPSQTTEPPTSDSREATPVGSPTPSGGMGARPDFVAGAEGVRASTPGDRIYTGEVQPNQFGGAQGVIDLGGIPVAEAKARSMQGNVRPQQVWDVTTQSFRDVNPQEQAAQVGPQQPYSDPNQLALQFAPPAPSGVGFTDQAAPIANPAMQQAMNLAQSREAQIQAQSAANAQREAELNKLQAQAEAQRQFNFAQAQLQQPDAEFFQQVAEVSEKLRVQGIASLTAKERQILAQAEQYFAEQQRTQQTPQQLPTKPLPIRAPQQLDLFSRKEAPRPSRAEGLRRGVSTQLPEPTPTPMGQQDLRRSAQVPMFTQQGAPSVAALRGAGTQQQVVPTAQQGAAQIAPTGAATTAVTSQAARGEALKKQKTGTLTFEDGSIYTGQLKKGEPSGQGTLIYSDTSTYTGEFKNGKPQGAGRFEDADGTVFDGQFDDGDFIQPEVKEDATQKGKQQQGRQSKRQQDNAGVQDGGQAGNQPKTQEQGGGTETGGGGKSLKRGKKQEVTPEETPPPPPPKGGKSLKKAPAKKTEAKAQPAPKAAQLQKGPSGLAAMVGQLMATTKQDAVVESQPVKRGVKPTSEETKIANEELDTAIETAETTKNATAYAEALYDIVSAYVYGKDRTYLLKTSTNFLSADEGGVSKGDYVGALREVALDAESIKPASRLYGLLADAGLLNDVNVMANVRIPGAKTTQEAVVGEEVGVNSKITPEERLANFIDNNTQYYDRQKLVKKLKDYYAKIDDDTFAVGKRGQIKDFFDAEGNPYVTQPAGTSYFIANTVAEEATTTTDFVAKHEAARKELRDLEDTEDQTTLDDLQFDPFYDRKPDSDDDWRAFRSDGKPLNPMKAGPLRLFVARVISKYARKPRVAVFANIQDMKRSNPALFEAAAKARKDGDIEAVNAAGMAWGDNVVLFADLIHSEEHARFIIAHETLGHVGFRGLFSNQALNKILQFVADADPHLTQEAIVYANGKGIPFLEAVEEVLADRAAAIDNNTVLRFWNWLKDQLNKIGLSFNDDAARYLISLSRKYIRQGVGRSEVNTSGLFKEITEALATEQSDMEVLRFAQTAAQGSAYFAQNFVNRDFAIYGGISRSIQDIVAASQKAAEMRKQGTGVLRNVGNVVQKVLDGIQTQDNMARKSKGYYKIFARLQDQAARQTELKTQYAEMTKIAHEAKFLGFGAGLTPEQSVRAGELMAYGTLLKMNQVSDTRLSGMDNVVFYDPKNLEPVPKLNPEAFEALKELGRVTPAEFRSRFKVAQGTEERPMTPEYLAQLEAERDQELAMMEAGKERELKRLNKKLAEATNEEAKLEFQLRIAKVTGKYDRNIETTKRAYTKRMAEKTYEAARMNDTPEWFKDVDGELTENDDGTISYTGNSIEYQVYLQFHDAISKSATDVLVGKYLGAIHEQKSAITAGVGSAFNQSLTAQETKFIEAVTEQYDEMRLKDSGYKDNRFVTSEASQEDADEWLNRKFGRSFYTDLALKDLAPMIKGYTKEEVETLVLGMRKKLRNKVDPDIDNVNDSSIWSLIRRIEERAMFTATINDDQFYAKRTIAGSYVPLTREGDWQIRMQAYKEVNGQDVPIKLRAGQQDSLYYGKASSQKDAMQLQAELDDMFAGDYDMRDADNNVQTVKLRAVVSVAEQTPALVDILHYDEVIYSLSRLGIQLTPETREILVKKTQAQNTRARSNLRRSGVGGWDKDVVRSASAYLEQQAYVAANKEFRHQYDEVLENPYNWQGDPTRLEELRVTWDNATGQAKEIAAREYFQEKFYYDNAVEIIDGKRVERGNWYKERAKSLLDWKESTGDIVHADDIWTNNEWSVATRTWAALAQLGGSIATGVTQMLSLPTNSWAYLASFNPKNGFGVGLGAARAATLLLDYGRKAGSFRYAKLEYIDQQIKELQDSGAERNKDGLTFAELNFLYTMTEEQRLDAAQFNALTGTSRGRKITGNPTAQKFIQVWMFPFSYSEQFNRRVTLLAAYRGEYDRQRASGFDHNQADIAARTVASRAVDATQGDYAQYNRPAFFRGLQSFIYMYKQYPIMMVQLLKNMNYEGRIIMLGSLLLLSGVRGIPGSDDILDIVDGLAQRLGLKVGSVEKEFARLTRNVFGDELAAEINPIVMRGLLDHFTGLSFSNRLGLGDIIPGTGLLKPSATKQEILREVVNIAGAPTSFLVGAFEYTFNTLPAVAAGRKSATALLTDSPARAIKNVGDAFKFYDTGAILDSKGYVVAQNATTWEILGKALGWYPARAQAQMDWLMADSQEQAYMSMIKTEATRQAVAARLSGDAEAEKDVKEYIKTWNESTQGTRLEIRNFDKGLNQAFREAKKPLALRSLKSSSKGGRAEAKELLRIYGVDEETLSGIPD
jgi:ribosomal protein L33